MTLTVGRALGAVSLLLLSACAKPAPVDTSADAAAVKAVSEHELAIMTGGQVDSLDAVFAPDVLVMPPNEPALHGTGAVKTWFQGMLGQMSMAGTYSTTHETVSGDWAIQHYAYNITMTPKAAGAAPMQDHGNGIHIMHKQADGKWLITQDIYASEVAMPAAPAPAPARHR